MMKLPSGEKVTMSGNDPTVICLISAKSLVLNTTHFYQMFGDDNFYKTLPPGFEPLVEPCKESHARALRIAMGQEEDPCSGCTTIRQALDKSINALGKQLHAVYRVDPDVLQPLKQYFCARLNANKHPNE